MMKALGGIVGFSCACILAIGVGAAPASEPQDPKPFVRCEKLEVVDKDGKARVFLATNEAGEPKLVLNDSSGKASLSLSVSDARGPMCELRSGASKAVIKLRMQENGSPRVEVFDSLGSPRVLIACDEDGTAAIVIADKEKRASISQVVDNSSSRIQMYDGNGSQRLRVSCPVAKAGKVDEIGFFLLEEDDKVRASLGFNQLGEPACVVFGEGLKSSAYLGAAKNGVGLGMKDQEGRLRAAMSVQESSPVIRMLNQEGASIWRAP